MKTLEEHNKEAMNRFKITNEPLPNGLVCPRCDNELFDSNPNVLLTSYPPKKNVNCLNCGYDGYRIA